MSNPDKTADPAPDRSGALEAEATDEPTVTFEWRGQNWTVPAGDDWPLEVGDAFSEIADSVDSPGRIPKYMRIFVKGLLGPAQWQRWKKGRTTGDLADFYQAIFDALGNTAGE